ncbi:outer membrane receptor for ferrienterochelin and colicin [Mucilaginibacter yixingensis]|uniref:Outer membrane receptor for ferrienterochelin and colicin n=2 Tax=Mucilaginibacter yixingensis TaxID=1295612 RepID=A0A2T5JEV5_9SPHI|nr:outer membrane receptor for ferrienterochelin and colicin [Mucilaginibacter yixingensis]
MLTALVHAQTKAPTVTIKGMVTDSVTQKPLGFVTAALTDATTRQPVKSTLSKDDGVFELRNLPSKSYQLALVYVGYQSKTIEVKGNASVDIGKIILSPANNQLKEVAVSATKPLMKQEVDRISYDVQADPESKALTALDMMRKVPLVSVDGNDNIRLKGTGNYKILINGKESALMAKNPSDVLKAMPASNIVRIEVITTPPAKYDAEGLAGILNIITKADADQGYNIGINGRINNRWGPGGNINGSVKQGKFGATAYFGAGKQTGNETANGTVQNIFAPGTTNIQSVRTQDARNAYGGNYKYGNAELSYEIDSLNLLTGSVNYWGGDFYNNNKQLFNSTGTSVSHYYLMADNLNNNLGLDAGLNYQLGFKRSKDQLLTLSYKYSYSPSKSTSNNLITDRQNYYNKDFPDYNQYNNSGNREHTIQLDYAHPLKKITIEAGAKAILRNNFSDFHRDDRDTASNTYTLNPNQTNNFNYKQGVYSLYNSYQLKLENWTAKAGLRLERTTVDADFTNLSTNSVNQGYNNLIPSVSIQRKFKKYSFTLGYTERIQRPGIYQLNPFVDRTDPKFINTGNPNLRPELSHSFELNYSNFSKNSFTLGLSYAFSNNAIQNVSTLITDMINGNPDVVTLTTYENLGSNKSLGLNSNATFAVTKQLNVSLNGQVSRVWLAGTFNGMFYKNAGYNGNAFFNGSYKFNKGYRVSTDVGYFSGNVALQGSSSQFIYSSFVVTKEFLDKKASISLVSNNPWATYQTYRSTTVTDNFYQSVYYQNIYRHFAIRFNYKFGKLKSEIKRSQHGINNDDTKGGSKSGSTAG